MRILRLPDVTHKTGLPCSSIYRLMESNQFPKSVQLAARVVGWVEEEIDQWISERIAERDNSFLTK